MDKKDINKVCEEVDVVGASDKIQRLINECYELPDEIVDDARLLRARMMQIIADIAKENDALANRHMAWLKEALHGHRE